MAEISKNERDNLWKELKLSWASLKRGSSANEAQKTAAKTRINEIQDELGLDKTDWEVPYQKGQVSKTSGGSAAGSTSIGTESIQKALDAILNRCREIQEEQSKMRADMGRFDATLATLISVQKEAA